MGDNGSAEEMLNAMFPNLDAALVRDVLHECNSSMGEAVDALILMGGESASSPVASFDPPAPAPQPQPHSQPEARGRKSGVQQPRPRPPYRPFPTAQGPPQLPPEWMQPQPSSLSTAAAAAAAAPARPKDQDPPSDAASQHRERWSSWNEEEERQHRGIEGLPPARGPPPGAMASFAPGSRDWAGTEGPSSPPEETEPPRLDKGKAPMEAPDDEDYEGGLPLSVQPRLPPLGGCSSSSPAPASSAGPHPAVDDTGFLLSCFPELGLTEETVRELLLSHGGQMEAVLGFLLSVFNPSASGPADEGGWEVEVTEAEREAQREYDRMAEDERLAVQMAFDDGMLGEPGGSGQGGEGADVRDMELAELCSEFPDYEAEMLLGVLKGTCGDVELAKLLLHEEEEEDDDSYEETTEAAAELEPRNRFDALEAAMAADGGPDLGDFRSSDATRRANRKLSMKLGRLQARFPIAHMEVLEVLLRDSGGDEKMVTAVLKAGGVEPLPDEPRDRSPPPLIPKSALRNPKAQPVPVERKIAYKQAKQKRRAALANPIDNDAVRQQVAAIRAENTWVQNRAKELANNKHGGDAGGPGAYYEAPSSGSKQQQERASELRRLGLDYKHLHNKLMRDSFQARSGGNHAHAAELVQSAKQFMIQSDFFQKKASKLMGVAKNAHRQNPAHTVDVHGQTRQEAQEKIGALIKAVHALGSNLELRVIVGKGIHSAGGEPVLKPALEEYLSGLREVENFYINPQNTGEIIVKVGQHGDV